MKSTECTKEEEGRGRKSVRRGIGGWRRYGDENNVECKQKFPLWQKLSY
jgi:hypothetical protein